MIKGTNISGEALVVGVVIFAIGMLLVILAAYAKEKMNEKPID